MLPVLLLLRRLRDDIGLLLGVDGLLLLLLLRVHRLGLGLDGHRLDLGLDGHALNHNCFVYAGVEHRRWDLDINCEGCMFVSTP
jgi:hypothetical protein